MKKYYFSVVLFLSVAIISSNQASAQQNPDIKYNKAKKEFRDAQAAKAAQSVTHKPTVTETAPTQTASPAQLEKAEALKSKAVKSSQLKAASMQKAAKEQTKSN